jgi:hypothetical protein
MSNVDTITKAPNPAPAQTPHGHLDTLHVVPVVRASRPGLTREIRDLVRLTPPASGSGSGRTQRQRVIIRKPASRRTCVSGDQGPVYRDMVFGHALGGETPLEAPPDLGSRERIYLRDRLDRASTSSTIKPETPCSAISGTDPQPKAMTGVPQAIVSII